MSERSIELTEPYRSIVQLINHYDKKFGTIPERGEHAIHVLIATEEDRGLAVAIMRYIEERSIGGSSSPIIAGRIADAIGIAVQDIMLTRVAEAGERQLLQHLLAHRKQKMTPQLLMALARQVGAKPPNLFDAISEMRVMDQIADEVLEGGSQNHDYQQATAPARRGAAVAA